MLEDGHRRAGSLPAGEQRDLRLPPEHHRIGARLAAANMGMTCNRTHRFHTAHAHRLRRFLRAPSLQPVGRLDETAASNEAKRRVVQLSLYGTRQTQRSVSLAVAVASMARSLFAAALLLAQLFFAAAGADYYKARMSRAATSGTAAGPPLFAWELRACPRPVDSPPALCRR